MLEIDMEHCPNCGGESKIIAAILEALDIQRILEQPGLPTLGGSGVNRSEVPLAVAPDSYFSRNHAALRQGSECRQTVQTEHPTRGGLQPLLADSGCCCLPHAGRSPSGQCRLGPASFHSRRK